MVASMLWISCFPWVGYVELERLENKGKRFVEVVTHQDISLPVSLRKAVEHIPP